MGQRRFDLDPPSLKGFDQELTMAMSGEHHYPLHIGDLELGVREFPD
jgi:hypothetical protein